MKPNIKFVSIADAIQAAANGARAFILTEMDEDTPVSILADADAFAVVENPDPEEKPPAPKPAVKPAAEKPKPKAAPKVDHGRILALYKAGWTIPRIADDVGCSQQTVYNHIKTEQESHKES